METFARFLCVLSLTVICVACGGGGGSAGAPPPPPLSSDAGATDITLADVMLDQVFQTALLNYTATVSLLDSTTTVTASQSDPNATMTVNGTVLVAGVASAKITLNQGNNTITLVVTAEDGAPGADGAQGEAGPPGPGVSLAGLRCPQGQFMVGFDSQSNLICESADGSPPTDPNINCIIDYSQEEAELIAEGLVQPLFDQLNSAVIPQITGSIQGVDFVITPGPVMATGQLSISAPLVELTEVEPCDDAIQAVIGYSSVAVTGEWSLDVIIGTVVGNFVLTVTGISADVLLSLENPDISGVMMTTLFERGVETVALTDLQLGVVDLQISGVLADDLSALFVPFLQSSISALVLSILSDVVADAVNELQVFSVAIPAPVIIEVSP